MRISKVSRRALLGAGVAVTATAALGIGVVNADAAVRTASATAIAAKSGFCRSVPKGTNPAAIISRSTKFSESLSNTSVFTGRSFWRIESSSPISIEIPPSPASAITWRSGAAACAPRAWGTALAIDPWLKEPMSRRSGVILK